MKLLNLITPWAPFSGGPSAYQSVYYRVLINVVAELKDLNLLGVADDSIVLQKIPWIRSWREGGKSYPGIVVCPWGSETMPITDGTNRRDDIGYPVLISVFQPDNEDILLHLDQYLLWREKIARHFRNQRLANVPEIIKVVPAPLPIMLPDTFTKGLWHSSISFRFISREVRGDTLSGE